SSTTVAAVAASSASVGPVAPPTASWLGQPSVSDASTSTNSAPPRSSWQASSGPTAASSAPVSAPSGASATSAASSAAAAAMTSGASLPSTSGSAETAAASVSGSGGGATLPPWGVALVVIAAVAVVAVAVLLVFLCCWRRRRQGKPAAPLLPPASSATPLRGASLEDGDVAVFAASSVGAAVASNQGWVVAGGTPVSPDPVSPPDVPAAGEASAELTSRSAAWLTALDAGGPSAAGASNRKSWPATSSSSANGPTTSGLEHRPPPTQRGLFSRGVSATAANSHAAGLNVFGRSRSLHLAWPGTGGVSARGIPDTYAVAPDAVAGVFVADRIGSNTQSTANVPRVECDEGGDASSLCAVVGGYDAGVSSMASATPVGWLTAEDRGQLPDVAATRDRKVSAQPRAALSTIAESPRSRRTSALDADTDSILSAGDVIYIEGRRAVLASPVAVNMGAPSAAAAVSHEHVVDDGDDATTSIEESATNTPAVMAMSVVGGDPELPIPRHLRKRRSLETRLSSEATTAVAASPALTRAIAVDASTDNADPKRATTDEACQTDAPTESKETWTASPPAEPVASLEVAWASLPSHVGVFGTPLFSEDSGVAKVPSAAEPRPQPVLSSTTAADSGAGQLSGTTDTRHSVSPPTRSRSSTVNDADTDARSTASKSPSWRRTRATATTPTPSPPASPWVRHQLPSPPAPAPTHVAVAVFMGGRHRRQRLATAADVKPATALESVSDDGDDDGADEVSLLPGDLVAVLERMSGGWARVARLGRGRRRDGVVPIARLRRLTSGPSSKMERDGNWFDDSAAAGATSGGSGGGGGGEQSSGSSVAAGSAIEERSNARAPPQL
ncbi:hypothetical protein HK405_003696, partial [Cladochytrium tenue]